MIDSKLILIEGVPCSGKSTTAINLMKYISSNGRKCECFLEWSDNNPIYIGEIDNLSKIISTTWSREQNVLRDWLNFTKKAKQIETINIIESRFWQTNAMYLYLSGHSDYEINKINEDIISVISCLNPVLIYLVPKDIRKMFDMITKIKNKTWQESGRSGSWDEWGNKVYEQQKWFIDRSLKGSDAVINFFIEWSAIADRLYEKYSFTKIKIQNPQDNWELSMSKIKEFLKI